ncbi:TPA_asm: tyrosine-type recombinase/integrase [Listeria monocytogenes]|nr:hypothetical protein [Listeria monocytogenes]EDO1144693.1 tyrosine-type recombinase/integrase [Listeria innocua]EAC8007150.1 hypothetical protein [Listeria monocytogenes]EAG8395226.1 hypothetical protein [Listeria monocytogenes]EAG8398264.1 hypothetical protein [Listeria monocytogenes]
MNMVDSKEVLYADGTRPLTKKEVEQLVQWLGKARTFKAYQYQTAVLFNVKAGLRVGELCGLTIEELYTADGLCRQKLYIYQSKNKKKRTIILPDTTIQLMTTYYVKEKLAKKARTASVFDFNSQAFRKMLRETNERYLGFTQFSTHSLRKTFANDVFNHVTDGIGEEDTQHNRVARKQGISIVQGLLQHSSPEITERYLGKELDFYEFNVNDF